MGEKSKVNYQQEVYEEDNMVMEVYNEENIKEEYTLEEPMLEMRVLIIGHMVMFIVTLLIIGSFFNVDQTNPSLILLKNAAFAGVGFLISASHTKERK